jgi:hypothetical protein
VHVLLSAGGRKHPGFHQPGGASTTVGGMGGGREHPGGRVVEAWRKGWWKAGGRPVFSIGRALLFGCFATQMSPSAACDAKRFGEVSNVSPGLAGHVPDPAIALLVFPQPIFRDDVGPLPAFDPERGYSPLAALPVDRLVNGSPRQ